MVDYLAKVPIYLCDSNEEMDRVAWSKGASVDIAIQVVAYQAIAMRREELYILTKPPFQHFPQRTEMNDLFRFLMLLPPNTHYDPRMAELVQCQSE